MKASLTVPQQPHPSPKAPKRNKKYSKACAPDLVIVAGISGSGKSNFLEQIQSGRLPGGLVLPAGARDWPVIGTKRPIWPPGAPGVILHYDMSGRGLWNDADYRDDPPLALVSQAKAIIVINVRPSIGRVIRQLTDRDRLKESAKVKKQKREQSRFIWRLAAPLIRAGDHILPRRLMSAIRHRTPFRDPQELQKKLRVYQQPGWLDELYARWGAYLDSVAQTGKPVRQVFIEPDAGLFRWRIGTRHPRSATPWNHDVDGRDPRVEPEGRLPGHDR